MLSDIANVLKSEKHVVPLITMGNSMSLSGSKDVTTSLLVLTLTLYAGNSGNSCSLHTEPCEVCCSGKKKEEKKYNDGNSAILWVSQFGDEGFV